MIQKLIDNYLEVQQEQREKRERSGKWSPSSFGRCYRYQYWNMKDEEKSDPVDKRTLRIFSVGNMFESWITRIAVDYDDQVKVENKDIKGYADLVGKDIIIDIKTIHSRAFWYMDKPSYDVNTSKETNILQVMTYAYLLKKKYGALVYVSKDDLSIREYRFSMDKWKNAVQNEIKNLKKIKKEDIVPPAKPRAYEGKECQYCPYKTKCKKGI